MLGESTTQLGPYRVESRLGAGGLGVVYRGTDTTLRRPVALKFLVGASDDERGRTRFLREARMAASLNHPTICKVHRVGEVEQALSIGSGESIASGTPYIVMEWVEGETLAERIARSPLPLSELADVAVQIAEGLEEAHGSGVVHRDLKPKNVMTTAQGRIKILDFGLARQTSPATPVYSSPEQLMGYSLDARSDQFSFGILLSEMATGRHPFAGESATPALPARLERIVERCLNKRPEDRYTSISELRGELEAFRHAIAPAVTTRERRRVRAWWGVAGIGLLAVAAGWWVLGRGTGPVLSPEARLVVLPFENLSEDPFETDYLAFGLSQSLNNRLSAAGLSVSPWDRVAEYVGSGATFFEIGRELNVDAVFEGTFEIAGDDVSVQLSLVDTESGATLWESSLNGSREELFELQRRMGVVCASLTGDLSAEQISKLSGDESSSLDAFDYYMQGSYLFVQGDPESIELAYQHFRRAVEIDSQFADAHVGLGAVHYARYAYGLGGGEEELELAEEAYSEAIRLKPGPGSLRARRGLIRIHWYRGRTRSALSQGEEAARVGRADDVETLLARAEAYMFGGLPDLSVPLFEKILELDPRNEAAQFHLVIAHGWSDRFDRAIAVGEDYLRRYGFEPEIHKHVAICYEYRNEPEQARRHHDLAIRGFNPRSTTIEVFLLAGQFYRSSGDEATAVRVLLEGVEQGLARLTENPQNAGTHAWLGALYAALGDVSSFEGHAATAIRLDPENGSFTDLIGQGHCMLGRNERAAELFEKTLQLGAFASASGPFIQWMNCGNLEGFGPYLEAYAEEERRLRSRYGPD